MVLVITFFGNRAYQDKGLAKELYSLSENGKKQIDLTEVTNFKWTKVAIFGRYTSRETIEESMNIKFKGNNGKIDMLEDRYLLVFANDKRAVTTVVLLTKYGSYSVKDNKYLIVEQ